MFHLASLRIFAGMLLWASALALLGVAYYTKVAPLLGKVEESKSIELMLIYMVAGAGIGGLFGALLNAFPRPIWPNTFAAASAILGLGIGREIAPFDWPFISEPNHNGAIMILIMLVAGAAIGFVPRHKGLPFPIRLPQDRAQVELDLIQRREEP